MAIKDEIKWFKEQFAADVVPALAGTHRYPLIWSARSRSRNPANCGASCACICRAKRYCGSRSATPSMNRTAAHSRRTRTRLSRLREGSRCSSLAHRLLVEMADATGIKAYQAVARRPHKFVHGYGIFQYDLQFFRRDPDFFLEQRWKSIEACVDKLMTELKRGLDQLDFSDKESLTDRESAFVAIVYNTGFGNFRESRELQQGHHDGTHFYGENIDRYLKIAHTIPTPPIGVTPPPRAIRAAFSSRPIDRRRRQGGVRPLPWRRRGRRTTAPPHCRLLRSRRRQPEPGPYAERECLVGGVHFVLRQAVRRDIGPVQVQSQPQRFRAGGHRQRRC